MGGFSGRQTLLARWNIADTAMAFYSCVDLQIGGGGGNPPPHQPAADQPAAHQPAAHQPPDPPPAGGTWAAGTAYSIGSTVTYGGASYRCRQAHTALVGWEPPNVPALWSRI